MKIASLDKNSFTFSQRACGFVELGRPLEWSKSLLNMILASLIALYVYQVPLDLITFIQGFFSVILLWSGLYAFNDYTDRNIDSLHEIKKERPIPSGRVKPAEGLLFSIVLLVLSFGLAIGLGNWLLILCLVVMMANQFLYTTKPFRFKTRKYVDIISGSVINPLFRYLSGLFLFVPLALALSTVPPILPLFFTIGIQFSGYSLYRLTSKEHDVKVKMKSSVALIPEKKIKRISYTIMGLAVLSYFLLLINGLTFKINWLGYLPPQYFFGVLIIAIFGLLVPDIRKAIRKPQSASMKKSYRALYLMNVAFVIGNIIVFALMP